MSDERPSCVFSSILFGSEVGATIAGVTTKTATGVGFKVLLGDVVLYKGITSGAALATGALTGGAIAGVLAALYLYRNEIADGFKACLKGLYSCIQSLFGGVKNVSKIITEMTEDLMEVERAILDDATSGTEKIFTAAKKAAKNISPSDKETVLSAMGGAFRKVREVNSTLKDTVQPVAKKYGVDASTMFERSEKLIDSIEQKWEQIAKDL